MRHLGLGASGMLRRSAVPRRLLHRALTYGLFALFDGSVVAAAYAAIFWLRFDGDVPGGFATRLPMVLVLLIPLYLIVNHLFGMYWRGWRYAGLHDAMMLAVAVSVSTG